MSSDHPEVSIQNSKNVLLEFCQRNRTPNPHFEYKIVAEDNGQGFHFESNVEMVMNENRYWAQGKGKNKKEASKRASLELIKILIKENVFNERQPKMPPVKPQKPVTKTTSNNEMIAENVVSSQKLELSESTSLSHEELVEEESTSPSVVETEINENQGSKEISSTSIKVFKTPKQIVSEILKQCFIDRTFEFKTTVLNDRIMHSASLRFVLSEIEYDERVLNQQKKKAAQICAYKVLLKLCDNKNPWGIWGMESLTKNLKDQYSTMVASEESFQTTTPTSSTLEPSSSEKKNEQPQETSSSPVKKPKMTNDDD